MGGDRGKLAREEKREGTPTWPPETPTKHTHTLSRLKSLTAGPLISTAEPRSPICPHCRWSTVSAAVRLHDLAGQIKEGRGAECYR